MADDATVGPPRLVVGLTGGIASGKSLVGAMFVKLGASLIDTDVVAREVVALGEPGLAAVAAEFGPRVLLPSGELNRPAVRSLVFADEAKRRRLEAILHPLIRARTLAKLAELESPYALVAVPLLVETNFGELVDRILVIDAPESAQLERLMRRDAIPKPEALEMIRAQVDRATRLKAAHDIIDNSGTIEATRRQVELAHRRYLDLAAQRARQF
ncbi:MAG TPA: dephospho-CoA kinase [Gammaproteobacteria bacterium]|nr:dephospho-CoA kinase [Gammaproteobacteria bacterium]